tara:strand:- start:168 stop:386 length:219 start_codon:yes stop_codon:yes gene_type:complete
MLHEYNLGILILSKPLNWIDYSMVLSFGGNNYFAIWVFCNPIPENALDRVIISLCATGVKNYFASVCPTGFC